MDKKAFKQLLLESLSENLTIDIKAYTYGSYMDGERQEQHELTVRIYFDGTYICEEKKHFLA